MRSALAVALALFCAASVSYAGQVPNPANISGTITPGHIVIGGSGQNVVDGGPPGTGACITGAACDASNMTVQPTGVSSPYNLLMAMANAQNGILLDTFFQQGDIDDTPLLGRACSQNANVGVPIIVGPRIYHVHDINISAGICTGGLTLRGTYGKSFFQRNSAAASFFTISSANIYVDGVGFDCNKASITANQWCVIIPQGGQNTYIANSVFKNNSGTLGSGLALLSTGATAGGRFTLEHDEFTGDTFSALYISGMSNGLIHASLFHDNPSTNGVFISSVSTSFYSTGITIDSNFAWNNQVGIFIGGIGPPYNFAQPWGARGITVSNNYIWDNTSSQITCQGDNLTIQNNYVRLVNLTTAEFGILCNSVNSNIIDNKVYMPNSSFAVDAGGSQNTKISRNRITQATGAALNLGATLNDLVDDNIFDLSGTGFGAVAFGADGAGVDTFDQMTSGLQLIHNQFNLNGASTRGIGLFDDAGGAPAISGVYSASTPSLVLRNNFDTSNSASSLQALTYFTSGAALRVQGNTVNNSNFTFADPNSSGDIVFTGVYDITSTVSSTNRIRSIISDYVNQYGSGGSILYIDTLTQGTGYNPATASISVTCSGSNPSGFTANPQVDSAGHLVWWRITNNGTGAVGTCTAVAVDTGGGTGWTGAVVNEPSLPALREISFYANAAGGNLVQASGGFIGINPSQAFFLPNGSAPLQLRTGFFGATVNAGGNWTLLSSPPIPIFPLNSTASFTGSISGNTLTVSGVTGTIAIGQFLGASGVADAFTRIIGGSGSIWTLNGPSLGTISAEAMTSSAFPPCTSSANTGSNGMIVGVTGATSAAWMSKCVFPNWLNPGGSTLN